MRLLWARLSRFLSMAFESLRFIKHYRERQTQRAFDAQVERAAERAHQIAMLDAVIRMVESLGDAQSKQTAETSAALIEIAKANQAQAAGFTSWIQSFQTLTPPTSSVVTDEDEYDAEQQRIADKLGLDAADLPEEFRLALELRQREFVAAVRDSD